jgi:hypothetical protein
MMKRILWMATAAAMLMAAVAQGALAGETPGKIDPKAAFEKLKTLAGEWNGTAGEGLSVPVIYKVSANGNVVMETLFAGTPHEMITMYHLAGGDLVATHYCSAGNQPRFKLDLAKSTPSELIFAFDGGTNFDPAKDGHIHNGRIGFAEDGKLEAAWAFHAGGKQVENKEFQLTRAAAK